MAIARVFLTRTSFTPTDDYAFIDEPPMAVYDDIDDVHISVLFTWDLPKVERIAKAWKRATGIDPKIGGPATGQRGEEFIPGMYVGNGAVITSRGCPNRCWFCSVPKREGALRELPIHSGTNILDDNLLACSEQHIIDVFEMLMREKAKPRHRKIKFTGGLEPKMLKHWHVEWLEKRIKPSEVFFAYDTPDDWEYLQRAAELIRRESGSVKRYRYYCYCLVGYPNDTFEAATKRLEQIKSLNITPYAMVYRDLDGNKPNEWIKFQTAWLRPAIIWGPNRDDRHLKIREKEASE